MNIDRIRKKLTGGFRPFIIRTSGGHEYEVPHPEFVAVGRSDIAVVDKEGDINVVDALHIVALKTPRASDGQARETQ